MLSILAASKVSKTSVYLAELGGGSIIIKYKHYGCPPCGAFVKQSRYWEFGTREGIGSWGCRVDCLWARAVTVRGTLVVRLIEDNRDFTNNICGYKPRLGIALTTPVLVRSL